MGRADREGLLSRALEEDLEVFKGVGLLYGVERGVEGSVLEVSVYGDDEYDSDEQVDDHLGAKKKEAGRNMVAGDHGRSWAIMGNHGTAGSFMQLGLVIAEQEVVDYLVELDEVAIMIESNRAAIHNFEQFIDGFGG